MSFFSASCRFIGWGSLENPRLCCWKQRILTLPKAMALWIPRRGTSSGEYRRRMTLMVMVLETMLPASFTPQLSTSFFSASCPFYGRRQSGESMTLLLKATHIDIAAAMALWIPRRGTSCGEYRWRMTFLVGIENDSLIFVASFVYPSPDTNVSTSPAGGEVLILSISFLAASHSHSNSKKSPHFCRLFIGRSDWIRISDLYVPNVAFYQAELHSVISLSFLILFFFIATKIFNFHKKSMKDIKLPYFSHLTKCKFIYFQHCWLHNFGAVFAKLPAVPALESLQILQGSCFLAL